MIFEAFQLNYCLFALKSVVKKLWFRYLKNQGIAFSKKESDTIDFSSKSQTGRFCRSDPEGLDMENEGRLFSEDEAEEDEEVLRELTENQEGVIKENEEDMDSSSITTSPKAKHKKENGLHFTP